MEPEALARETAAAVREVVARQLEVGIDIGNAGEQPRPGFSTYVDARMEGFGGESRRSPSVLLSKRRPAVKPNQGNG